MLGKGKVRGRRGWHRCTKVWWSVLSCLVGLLCRVHGVVLAVSWAGSNVTSCIRLRYSQEHQPLELLTSDDVSGDAMTHIFTGCISSWLDSDPNQDFLLRNECESMNYWIAVYMYVVGLDDRNDWICQIDWTLVGYSYLCRHTVCWFSIILSPTFNTSRFLLQLFVLTIVLVIHVVGVSSSQW